MQKRTETKRDLILFLTALAATVAAVNWSMVWLLGSTPTESRIEPRDNLALVEFKRVQEGPSPAIPIVLMMGNSHTYALPGTDSYSNLRVDCGDIFLNGMATRLHQTPDS